MQGRSLAVAPNDTKIVGSKNGKTVTQAKTRISGHIRIIYLANKNGTGTLSLPANKKYKNTFYVRKYLDFIYVNIYYITSSFYLFLDH